MKTLGYIVQYLDEAYLNPNGSGKRLFREFDEAHNHAREIMLKWYETNTEKSDGPVEINRVTKQMVDDCLSVLLFRSAEVFIWIEIVYE